MANASHCAWCPTTGTPAGAAEPTATPTGTRDQPSTSTPPTAGRRRACAAHPSWSPESDYDTRIERLAPYIKQVRGVAEDLHDAKRFMRRGHDALADIALQFAECKAGLRERVTPQQVPA